MKRVRERKTATWIGFLRGGKKVSFEDLKIANARFQLSMPNKLSILLFVKRNDHVTLRICTRIFFGILFSVHLVLSLKSKLPFNWLTLYHHFKMGRNDFFFAVSKLVFVSVFVFGLTYVRNLRKWYDLLSLRIISWRKTINYELKNIGEFLSCNLISFRWTDFHLHIRKVRKNMWTTTTTNATLLQSN